MNSLSSRKKVMSVRVNQMEFDILRQYGETMNVSPSTVLREMAMNYVEDELKERHFKEVKTSEEGIEGLLKVFLFSILYHLPEIQEKEKRGAFESAQKRMEVILKNREKYQELWE